MEFSAGIIAYRHNKDDNGLEVMLSHSGGPYYENDERAWTIQKGRVEAHEDEEYAARREFREETGFPIKDKLRKLGTFKVSKNKIVAVYYINKNLDASKATSNSFEMEWPKDSGQMCTFPENDKAEWFGIDEAKEKVFFGQVKILERLEEDVKRFEEQSKHRKYIHKPNLNKGKKRKKKRHYVSY